jgi:N6-adenosine-specific RNA methylase IME4
MFNVILADPPWHFRTWSDKGAGRSPEYPTMTLAELQALLVGSLVSDSCALFLWCTWPVLFRDVPGLLQAWGFEYKTLAFMWVKANKAGAGLFTGMGYYTRANTEPCLLAVRGKMPVAAHNVHQVIYSPVRRHSQKPNEQYQRIEALYPGGRFLELFARARRPGWAAWGNEVDSDSTVIQRLTTQAAT